MKIFVFDLDFTLWNAGDSWCDTTNPPYFWKNLPTGQAGGKLLDQSNAWIRLYPDVMEILTLLKKNNKIITVASRTNEPAWARDLLKLLDIDHFFDLKEIYPSGKTRHLKNIQHHFQIPYSEMVFFDDEYRNIEEVGALGVEAVLVRNGISMDKIIRYL